MISTLTLALALVAGPRAGAEEGPGRPFLHPLFTDHVVLQRDVPTPVWGWAEPGQRVKVALAGQSVETTADARGKWMARLGPYPAGGPHVLAVSGPKAVEIKDVLVGDVWLCSGQSNMEWPLKGAVNPEAEVAAADYPRLRLFQVPKKTALEPESTVEAKWDVCTPATAPGFSAVGYFFGRDLGRDLNVPIGLINSSWGGTVAEAWTSAPSLGPLGDFDKALAQVRASKAEAGQPPVRLDRAMAAWWKRNDPGTSDQPGWADPKFDAAAWKTMDLPGNWEERGLPDFDGIAWFRKDFDLPEAWDGKDLTLALGPIDDLDTTYLNGVEVGHTDAWATPRKYKVPAGVAKAGRNVIAIRVLDRQGQGGFGGEKGDMKLAPAGDEQAGPIALAGPWSFKVAANASDLSSPPEAQGENPNRASVLYNGMIAPLAPFPIKGAIWYQGEGNAGRPAQYRRLLPTLIRDWRAAFAVGDFPFLIVQLANYLDRNPPAGRLELGRAARGPVPHDPGAAQRRRRPGHRHRRGQGHPPPQQAGGRPPARPRGAGDGLRQGRRVVRPGLQGGRAEGPCPQADLRPPRRRPRRQGGRQARRLRRGRRGRQIRLGRRRDRGGRRGRLGPRGREAPQGPLRLGQQPGLQPLQPGRPARRPVPDGRPRAGEITLGLADRRFQIANRFEMLNLRSGIRGLNSRGFPACFIGRRSIPTR